MIRKTIIIRAATSRRRCNTRPRLQLRVQRRLRSPALQTHRPFHPRRILRANKHHRRQLSSRSFRTPPSSQLQRYVQLVASLLNAFPFINQVSALQPPSLHHMICTPL